jgi:hypothetical protein
MRSVLLVGVLALALGGASGCKDSRSTPAVQVGTGQSPAATAGTGAGVHPGPAKGGGRFPNPPK